MLRLFSASILFLLPQIASAHSFGRLYNLPVPFSLYLFAGAAAMVISFLFIGYFLGKKNSDDSYGSRDISENKFVKLFLSKNFIYFLKLFSVFLLFLTIFTGIFGVNNSYVNWNMTFFWVIFLLGFTYLTALFGDIYSKLNPWRTITDWLIGKDAEVISKYPQWLGYYPALLFYFILIWLELIGETTPFKLSIALLAYLVINDIGVIWWGRDAWYKYGEFFGVFFRMVSKIAPVEYTGGRVRLRSPYSGILREKAPHFSLLLFVIFMLASTAFDGFKETLLYLRLYFRHVEDFLRPLFGNYSHDLFATFVLLLFPFLFLGIYLLCIWLAKIICRSDLPLKELSLQFTFSLIPIAVVYHVAHYYTLLFTEAPSIIRLISNPFGLENNFFNTADYYQSIILPASFIWHSQVALILAGHIASVYLTHVVALKIFPEGKGAFHGQIPMLILMVAFTLIGLWILAQPVTGGAL